MSYGNSKLFAELRKSINKSLSFLWFGFRNQKIILSEVYDDLNESHSGYEVSVYIPTFILHSLGFVRNLTNVSTMISCLTRYLLNEMENGGVWKFYGRNEIYPPPDFDDTCCALAVLRENAINVKTELWKTISNYRSSEGLFYTWIDDEMNRRENYHIDGVVNSNITYCGALYGIKFYNIIEFINHSSRYSGSKKFSRWFESPYPIFYIISRIFMDGKVSELNEAMSNIVRFLHSNQNSDGSWGNRLDTTLALATLVNAGYFEITTFEAIRYLIRTQEESGSMGSYPFFRATRPVYYGSPYLTTSIFVEALAKILLV